MDTSRWNYIRVYVSLVEARPSFNRTWPWKLSFCFNFESFHWLPKWTLLWKRMEVFICFQSTSNYFHHLPSSFHSTSKTSFRLFSWLNGSFGSLMEVEWKLPLIYQITRNTAIPVVYLSWYKVEIYLFWEIEWLCVS